MAKLRLISRPIPWFLLVRAAAFGAAWFFLPRWLFFCVALYLYFRPFFRSSKLLLPFALVIFFAFLLPVNLLSAALLGTIFFLVLGVKELFFIDRFSAYELLIFLLLFLGFLNFFSRFENWKGVSPFFWSLVIGFAFWGLFRGAMGYYPVHARPRHEGIAAAVAAFLVWECAWLVLFLPFTFFYQAALLLLFAATITEFGAIYAGHSLDRDKLTSRILAFAVFVFVILVTARWTL